MMTTMEMSATMNANRTLIDARLDAIDRALLGRVSRAERLDVVGEVESRIDEFLRERCGPGAEPSREDVLTALARLDPPEAYLGDEPLQHESGERPAARAPVAPPAARSANWPVILGLIAASGAILFPIGWIVALTTGVTELVIGFWALTGFAMMLGGTLAVALGLVERPRRPMTTVGLIAGAGAFGFGLAGGALTLLFMIG